MRIAGVYSFNNGESVVRTKYPFLLSEVEQAIANIDAAACKVKESKRKRCRVRCSFPQ